MRRLAAVVALLLAGCGADEPPEDRLVGSVPPDARAYVHLDRDAGGWRRADEALGKLPALESLLLGLLPSSLDTAGDGETALALLPDRREPLVINEPRDLPRSLEDNPAYGELVADLDADRFAHAWLGLPELARFRSIDDSLQAVAASASAAGDSFELRVRARHRGAAGPCARGRGGSELLEAADSAAALYLEVPSIGCAIRLAARRIPGAPRVLGRFSQLLPLLDSRGALVAGPGESAPVFTLIVDDVDEDQALDVLAGLQPTLIDLLGTEALGHAPAFGAVEVEGVTAATAQLAPGLELSYAAWDGRLVVSTALEGVAAVRRAEGLPGGELFESVLGDRPESASALLFLDLNQLLALGEQAGLAEDERYLAVRDDLQKLRAAGAVISREENFTTAELTFQIP